MKESKPELQLVGRETGTCGDPAEAGAQPAVSPHEQEAFYHLLFESSNDILLVHPMAPDGSPQGFTDVNQAACQRLGYSRQELLRMSPRDIDDPTSTRDEGAMFARLLVDRQALFERVFVTKDGRKFPVEINIRQFELGGRPMILAIARDISTRKQAEERAHLATEQLEAVFAHVHALIAYLDCDFNFIRVNRPYAAADGREPEFFVGKNHFALYPNAENQAIFRKVVESGEAYRAYAKPFEYPDHPEAGITYWDWTLSPVKGERGRVAGLILTLVDVTENRLAWLALEEAQKNLSGMFAAISESVLLLDTQGGILEINPAGARRLESVPEYLIGRNVFDLLPPAVASVRRAWIEQLRRDKKPLHVEDERDGTYFEHSIYPIFDAAGGVVRYAVYSADVTERRRLELIEKMRAEINQKVLDGESPAELMAFVCARVVDLLDFPLAWIGRKLPDGSVATMAADGEAIGYREELERVGVRWDSAPYGMGPTGRAISTGQVKIYLVEQKGFKPWRAAAERYGFQAIIAIPLIVRGEIYGALTLYSRHAAAFDSQAMVQHLNGIAGKICASLETAMIQERLRLLSAALETTSNAVFITDLTGRIQWVNAAFTHMTGYSAGEALDQTPRILNSGKQNAEYYRKLWETVTGGASWSAETIERRKDGSLFTVQQTITPILDEDAKISHFISILEDITVRKRTEERIRHMAEYDALTELPNRALFYDRLQRAMLLTRRNRSRLALLYLDLDRFKAVNDALGHHVGDLLLQAASQRLKDSVRESDTVARLGGDEFAVILPQIETVDDAATVANKIVAALTRDFRLDEHVVGIGTSIGIAVYGEMELATDELVRRADAAMYAAKKAGGNAFRFAV